MISCCFNSVANPKLPSTTKQSTVFNGNTSDELVSGFTSQPKSKPVNYLRRLETQGKAKSEECFERKNPLLKTNSVESPTFPRKLHDNEYAAPSRQRVKLDKLSEHLFTSLSYLSISSHGQQYKNPMLQACRKMFRDFHTEYCLTLPQYESLMDVTLPVSQSYIETTSIRLNRAGLAGRKEWIVGVDYTTPDFKPLNQKPDGKREGISSLVFKVGLLNPDMREKHGVTVVVKVGFSFAHISC